MHHGQALLHQLLHPYLPPQARRCLLMSRMCEVRKRQDPPTPTPSGQQQSHANPASIASSSHEPLLPTYDDEDEGASLPTIAQDDLDTISENDESTFTSWECAMFAKSEPVMWHSWELHAGMHDIYEHQSHFVRHAKFVRCSEHYDTRESRLLEDLLEIELGPRMASWFVGAPQLAPDEILVFKASASELSSAQIEKNFDALSPDDINKFWPLVEQAIRKEVASFNDLGTFIRAPRSSSSNTCTSRWVLRWKLIEGVRSVKARLTIRGFQDVATDKSTYASTASRWGQRVICSVSAQKCWTMFTLDVGAAFLRGLTFAELSNLTGSPIRDVCFVPPKGSEKYFQELGGLANLNFNTEVLRLVKPACGLRDAPRAWRIRLHQVLVSLGGRSLPTDNSLYVFFTPGPTPVLDGILSAHVDDLKGGATTQRKASIIAGLTKAFGTLKQQERNFEHCGIMHTQTDEKITLDQTHYAMQLRPIDLSSTNVQDINKTLSESMQSAFLSLLGGLSWLVQTRVDICVYVCALQRAASKATIGHVQKINKLCRWVQRKKFFLTYCRLQNPIKILDVSDSAFRTEDTSGLALRGAIIGVCEDKAAVNGTPGGTFHVIEYFSRKQRRVTRSTFAAELHGLADSVEIARMISITYAGILLPKLTTKDLQSLEDKGALPLAIDCVVDCRSVYDALSCDEVKTPSEASLVLILHSLKESLLTHNIRRLWWINTLDMCSDALTKGAISRKAVFQLGLSGRWMLLHPVKVFQECRHQPLQSHIEA